MTTERQPLEVQGQEARAAMEAGDRLEDAVAEVQAAIEDGNTAFEGAIDQDRRGRGTFCA